MARTREFDPADALDRAMKLFWHRGYAETSMRDLVAATGVAHAGLYGEFGGKRELFLRALKHYNDTFGNMLMGPLEAEGAGRAEVEGFFETVLGAIREERFRDGCLMCNTAVEFGDESGAILDAVAGNVRRMTEAFERALARAVTLGQVRPFLDPKETAEFLTNLFHGTAVLSRAKTPIDQIERSVRVALRTLD